MPAFPVPPSLTPLFSLERTPSDIRCHHSKGKEFSGELASPCLVIMALKTTSHFTSPLHLSRLSISESFAVTAPSSLASFNSLRCNCPNRCSELPPDDQHCHHAAHERRLGPGEDTRAGNGASSGAVWRLL